MFVQSIKGGGASNRCPPPPPPLCDIPSGGCFFTGPWTLTRSPLRMLRWVTAFCRPLRPVLLLVSFPRSRSTVVSPPPTPPPPEEVWAFVRAHRRPSAHKRRQKIGFSVGYKTIGIPFRHKVRDHRMPRRGHQQVNGGHVAVSPPPPRTPTPTPTPPSGAELLKGALG